MCFVYKYIKWIKHIRYYDIQDDYWYQTLVSLVEEGQPENESFSDVLQESRRGLN